MNIEGNLTYDQSFFFTARKSGKSAERKRNPQVKGNPTFRLHDIQFSPFSHPNVAVNDFYQDSVTFFTSLLTGTKTELFAGYRACKCLEGFYRTHMFEKCHKCGKGVTCQDEYASLKSGYWWRWRNKTRKDRYMVFIANLVTSLPALTENDIQYPYPLPTPYRCPIEDSCKGDLDSLCEIGYEGPLCAVCSSGYYKQLQTCKKCPSKHWIAVQLTIIVVIFLILIAASTNKTKNNKDKERSLIDSFLSKLKIAIGFYQVTNGLLEAFSYIKWPDSLQVISKYSEILQLNILQVAPIHCLSPGLHVDAFENLFAIMAINGSAICFSFIAYKVRQVIILRNRNQEEEEKSIKVAQTKELVYRNLFFFLYVTYLSTCAKTATLLPLACTELCRDEKEGLCFNYLKADYSTRCDDQRYKHLIIVTYISTVYIIALPAATFIALWRRRRVISATADAKASEVKSTNTGMITGLRFLVENYKPCSWYWELVEMSRKVIVTCGLILVEQESRSFIGLTFVVNGMYGTLFAWIRPIQEVFENRLMATSLAVTVFNLGIGAISEIPAENSQASINPYMDKVIFNVLALGANVLVLGLFVGKI